MYREMNKDRCKSATIRLNLEEVSQFVTTDFLRTVKEQVYNAFSVVYNTNDLAEIWLYSKQHSVRHRRSQRNRLPYLIATI